MYRITVAVLSFCLTVYACGADKPTSDNDRLQGTWEMTSLKAAGREFPEDYVRERATTVVIEGDKWTESVKGHEKDPSVVTIKLDSFP
jgi:uncharacterized protein (TIGR03067 family)